MHAVVVGGLRLLLSDVNDGFRRVRHTLVCLKWIMLVITADCVMASLGEVCMGGLRQNA